MTQTQNKSAAIFCVSLSFHEKLLTHSLGLESCFSEHKSYLFEEVCIAALSNLSDLSKNLWDYCQKIVSHHFPDSESAFGENKRLFKEASIAVLLEQF